MGVCVFTFAMFGIFIKLLKFITCVTFALAWYLYIIWPVLDTAATGHYRSWSQTTAISWRLISCTRVSRHGSSWLQPFKYCLPLNVDRPKFAALGVKPPSLRTTACLTNRSYCTFHIPIKIAMLMQGKAHSTTSIF